MADLVQVINRNEEMVHKDASIIKAHQLLLERASFFFHKPIAVSYRNSEYQPNVGEGTHLQAFMWSAEEDAEMILPDVDTAFGYKYCTDGVFIPQEGYLTYGDDVPLIQYKDGNFYFLYDVCEYNTQDELLLMNSLINGILAQIAGSEEAVELEIERNAKIENDKCIKALTQRLTEREKQNKQRRADTLANNKRKIEDYRRELRQLNLSVIVDEKMMISNNDAIEQLEQTLANELEIIKSNKKVTSVTVNNDGLISINTKTIFANVRGKDRTTRRYRFGDYTINVDVSNGNIRFFNQNTSDKRQSCWGAKCHHPHVDEKGSGCLGNATTLIMDCVDRYQWGALADVLINYLESVNVDDSAGKYFYKWDMVDTEGKKLPNQYDGSY